MSGILAEIVARTRQRLASEPVEIDEVRRKAAERAASRPAHAFATALRHDGVNVIAEIKAASPSAGSIVRDPNVEEIAAAYRGGGASAISVVTERDSFNGSPEWIARAARAAGLPVIMKDFIVEESQLHAAVAAGANCVLLLASLLDAGQIGRFIAILETYGCDALVEVHDQSELQRAVGGGAKLIGVNNRDLRTFAVDLGTSERLAPQIPEGVIRVAESGIRSHEDVMRLRNAGFHAFLVGESLLRQNDRSAAVRQLVRGGIR